MSELKKNIAERNKRDKAFAKGYDEGYEQSKIGAVLKQTREEAGLTPGRTRPQTRQRRLLSRGSRTMQQRISSSQPWRKWPMPSASGSK